jgi:hypothetical protein
MQAQNGLAWVPPHTFPAPAFSVRPPDLNGFRCGAARRQKRKESRYNE